MHSAAHSAADACFYTFQCQIAVAADRQSDRVKLKAGALDDRKQILRRNEEWELREGSNKSSTPPLSQGSINIDYFYFNVYGTNSTVKVGDGQVEQAVDGHSVGRCAFLPWNQSWVQGSEFWRSEIMINESRY